MQVEGLSRTRHAIVEDVVGLEPSALLTASDLERARRRMSLLPATMSSRISYRPRSGRAAVDVAVSERPLVALDTAHWVRAGIRAATDRTVRLDVSSPTGNGERWGASWRWWLFQYGRRQFAVDFVQTCVQTHLVKIKYVIQQECGVFVGKLVFTHWSEFRNQIVCDVTRYYYEQFDSPWKPPVHNSTQFDIAIIGGGLAGITAALELLDHKLKVVIIDRDSEQKFGGLAMNALGGMALVNTPIQRLHRIHDSAEIALKDWHSFAQFSDNDIWPKQWAELYVNRSVDDIYNWLKPKGISFFPIPHWVERGESGEGNSVPRYHIIWGTGLHLMRTLIDELRQHSKAANLSYLFDHRVESLSMRGQAVSGVQGIHEINGQAFEIDAPVVLVASGGINGSIERVKREWDQSWGQPPEHILNGAHKYADGRLHDAVENINGKVSNLHQILVCPLLPSSRR